MYVQREEHLWKTLSLTCVPFLKKRILTHSQSEPELMMSV